MSGTGGGMGVDLRPGDPGLTSRALSGGGGMFVAGGGGVPGRGCLGGPDENRRLWIDAFAI